MKKNENSAAYYEVIESEAKVVQMVFDIYTQQNQSINAIARMLNQREIPTPPGTTRWERSTVWGMLRNPAYRGRACFGKTEIRPPQRIKWEWEHLLFIQTRVRSMECDRRRVLRQGEAPDLPKIKQLAMLRGIGPNGAWVLVREFFGWRNFNNRKELGSLAGLTPTPFRSGTLIREQGISKAGNRHIREIGIELGWCWVRYQPGSKLTRWFEKRFGEGGPRARKIGIVALSRRLLIDLWRFLETGALPEGATLKANS